MKNMIWKVFLCLCFPLYSGFGNTSGELIVYDTTNSPLPTNNVQFAVQDNQGVYWFACDNQTVAGQQKPGGLASFDGSSWQVYQTSNCGIPSDRLVYVMIDRQENIWVTTRDGGIGRFDGQNWLVFDTNNSPLPDNYVYTMNEEPGGVLWIGMRAHGLVRYDWQNWQWYHAGNSPLGSDAINFIVLDDMNVKWIGTDYYGLQSFDDTTWTDHGQGLLSPGVNTTLSAMVIDSAGAKWVAGIRGFVGGAVARVVDTTWTFVNSLSQGFIYAPAYRGLAIDHFGKPWLAARSGLVHVYSDTLWELIDLSQLTTLPVEYYGSLIIDRYNNKIVALVDSQWTTLGVGFYNEDSVVVNITQDSPPATIPSAAALRPNYPNPFNAQTRIEFTLPHPMEISLSVYNILGQQVALLKEGRLSGGAHRVTFDAAHLSSGVYNIVLKTPQGVRVRKAVLLK